MTANRAAHAAPILVYYAGSETADTALKLAIIAFDRPMVVACYWQPFAESDKPLGIDLLEVVQDPQSINDREQALARRTAEAGSATVTAEGGSATGIDVKISTPINEAILRHADELDALAIVLGSRRRSAIESILPGDAVHELIQLSNCPVFVVSFLNPAELPNRAK